MSFGSRFSESSIPYLSCLSYYSNTFPYLNLSDSVHPPRIHHCLLIFLSGLHFQFGVCFSVVAFGIFFLVGLYSSESSQWCIPLAAMAEQIQPFTSSCQDLGRIPWVEEQAMQATSLVVQRRRKKRERREQREERKRGKERVSGTITITIAMTQLQSQQ